MLNSGGVYNHRLRMHDVLVIYVPQSLPIFEKKKIIGGHSMSTWIRTGQGNYKGIIMHEKCGRNEF